MIQPYEYIRSFDFLEDIKEDITILSDLDAPSELPAHITYLSLQQVIANPKQKLPQNTIGIAQQLTSQEIIALQSRLDIQINRISLDSGLSSILHKNSAEKNDIVRLLKEQYLVVNPYSHEHLIQSLLSNTLSYIRVMPAILPDILTTYTLKNSFLYQKAHNKGATYTILTDPSSLEKILIIKNALQDHGQGDIDIFIQHNYSTILSEEFTSSLEATEHLIIVLNHQATQELWLYYDTLIKENDNLKDIDIQFIFPQTHLITSLLEEYIEEEASFDVQHILEFLH